MTVTRIILIWFLIAAAFWSCVNCHVEVPASCNYDEANNVLDCEYLQASSMDLLQQALEQTSRVATSFSVNIRYCDGPSVPLDVFTGINLTSAWFFQNNFSAIPYQLFSSIDALIDTLSISGESMTPDTPTSTDLTLPFAGVLAELDFAEIGLQTIDLQTFDQYTNLIRLRLYSNSLGSVGMEYLGLGTLEELNLEQNHITDVETGAFQDLANLKTLYLSQNRLTTLQEGAFDGLETSPISTIGLNGNPWNCSCELQWLKDWLNDRNLGDASGAYCIFPLEGFFNDFDFCNNTATLEEF